MFGEEANTVFRPVQKREPIKSEQTSASSQRGVNSDSEEQTVFKPVQKTDPMSGPPEQRISRNENQSSIWARWERIRNQNPISDSVQGTPSNEEPTVFNPRPQKRPVEEQATEFLRKTSSVNSPNLNSAQDSFLTHNANHFSEPLQQMPSEAEQTIFRPTQKSKNPSIREMGKTDEQTRIGPPRKTEKPDN